MKTSTPLFEHGLKFANMLIREIENSRSGWRLERESRYRRDIELYCAIRESDAEKLAPSWWWEEEGRHHKNYFIDPLGARIPEVWSDLLFGAEPVFEAQIKGDQEQLDEWVDDNDFPSSLRWAEEICSSEGEVWWRQVSVPALDRAMTEFHSRLNVIPLYIGRKLVAAAFVSVLYREPDSGIETVYIETHAEGLIINKLYEARAGSKLSGHAKSLDSHDGTAGLPPVWNHGLEMLCGRVPNKLGRDWRCGLSDYKGITGLILALNETVNIGQENVRLTAKQRVVIPERYLDTKGRLPRGTEVIIATEVDQDPDKVKNEFAQIEWSFDAKALIDYKGDLVNAILTRARIAPQLAGLDSQALSNTTTGPGFRATLVDTLLAADGKAGFWDDSVPTIIQQAMKMENLPGLNNGWTNTDKRPHFKRNDSLPDDPESTSRRTVMEVNSNVLSRQTAIEQNNPNWGDQRVAEELKRIRGEKDLMLKATSAPDGTQKIPDPAGSIPRAPGQPDPTVVPDPRSAPAG